MPKISLSRAIENIDADIADSKRMLDKIQQDPRRNLDQPNEKLHYWDGRVTGLKLALEQVKSIRLPEKGWDQ
jgi:hypothetical protein